MTQIKFFWNLCSKKGSLPPSAASLFTMVREGDNFCIERGNNFCHLPPPSSFSLDQATLFLPALIGPCSPVFFSLGFLSGFPLYWSAVLKLSCQLGKAEQCERIISATAASVPLCTLQRGAHLSLWQGVAAHDDISGLRIKRLSWRTLFLLFLIQCLYSGLFLFKDSPWHLSLWILFFSHHFF